MLTFAVCILFGAHPDAFLPEPEFAAKYLAKDAKHVESCLKSLADSVDDILYKSIEHYHFEPNVKDQKLRASSLDKAIALYAKRRAEKRLMALTASEVFKKRYGERDYRLNN
jgi:hypothetical protein